MAKRRKKNPNIPQATLDRARRQAGLEPEAQPAVESPVAPTPNTNEPAQEKAQPVNNERVARRRKNQAAQLERNRRKGELTNDMIQDMLANPTTFVSEEQLHNEYEHVLVDLRNMGILAAALMVLLVALAQFI